MARLDIKTLVLAFEKRISELEKNPPDKVSTAVVVTLLERAVEEVIKEHFLHLLKSDLEKAVEKEFKAMKDEFVEEIIENVLTDDELKQKLQGIVKHKILVSFNP